MAQVALTVLHQRNVDVQLTHIKTKTITHHQSENETIGNVTNTDELHRRQHHAANDVVGHDRGIVVDHHRRVLVHIDHIHAVRDIQMIIDVVIRRVAPDPHKSVHQQC